MCKILPGLLLKVLLPGSARPPSEDRASGEGDFSVLLPRFARFAAGFQSRKGSAAASASPLRLRLEPAGSGDDPEVPSSLLPRLGSSRFALAPRLRFAPSPLSATERVRAYSTRAADQRSTPAAGANFLPFLGTSSGALAGSVERLSAEPWRRGIASADSTETLRAAKPWEPAPDLDRASFGAGSDADGSGMSVGRCSCGCRCRRNAL